MLFSWQNSIGFPGFRFLVAPQATTPRNIPVPRLLRKLRAFLDFVPRYFMQAATPPNIPVACPFRFLRAFPAFLLRSFSLARRPPISPSTRHLRAFPGYYSAVFRLNRKAAKLPGRSTPPRPPGFSGFPSVVFLSGQKAANQPGRLTPPGTPGFPRLLFPVFPQGHNPAFQHKTATPSGRRSTAAILPRLYTPAISAVQVSGHLFCGLSHQPQPRNTAQDRHPFGEAVNRGNPSPALHAGHIRGSGFRAFVPRPFPPATTPQHSPRPPPLRGDGQPRQSFPVFPAGHICGSSFPAFPTAITPHFTPNPQPLRASDQLPPRFTKTPAGLCRDEHQPRHL